MKTMTLGLLVACGFACNDSPSKRFEDQQKNMPPPKLDVSKQPTVDLSRNEAADVMVTSVLALIDKKDGVTVAKAVTDIGGAIDGLQHAASAPTKEAVHAAVSRLNDAGTAPDAGAFRDALEAEVKALDSAEVPLANDLIKTAKHDVETLDRGKSVADQDTALRHATCTVASATAVASALNALDCATLQ